jgi:hypothetical protein
VLLHPVEQGNNRGVRVRLVDGSALVSFTVDPHERVKVMGGSKRLS